MSDEENKDIVFEYGTEEDFKNGGVSFRLVGGTIREWKECFEGTFGRGLPSSFKFKEYQDGQKIPSRTSSESVDPGAKDE